MPAVRHRLVGTTVRDRLAARLRGEEGFGLIELLIAMLVMALGIMAIVAGFSSGIVALSNASRTGTAGTLADRQMEAYRALPYSEHPRSRTATPDATYTADPAYDSRTRFRPTQRVPSSTPTLHARADAGLGPHRARRQELSPRHVHRWSCPVGTPRPRTPRHRLLRRTRRAPVKKVTVVVRDGANPSKTYVRETSTFDAAT